MALPRNKPLDITMILSPSLLSADFARLAEELAALEAAGVTWLQSKTGVFPTVTFCPTGGIKMEDVPGSLALPNCGTIGCSWVAPSNLVQAHDWPAITELARRAAAMRGASV